MYDFDRFVDRRNVGACKYLGVPGDILPMTIADMEFTAPPEVIEALKQRAEHGNFGYTMMTDRDYQAVISFVAKRHSMVIPREHLLATPGVLNTMRCAMYALTEPGDKVVVILPLHTPSIRSASMQGRIACESWMKRQSDGNYTLDFEDLEKHFIAGAKVLMMCSPHNPTGRVWRRDELTALAELVQKYDCMVISDEIHRDLVYPGHTHIPLATLPGMEKRVITVFSASKTFNLGGCHIGSAVIADEHLKEKIRSLLYEYGHECGRPPLFSLAAQTTAYEQGERYLEEMIAYLDQNVSLAMEYLQGTALKIFRPEASFLLWADCSAYQLTTRQLAEKLARAGVSADPGHYYDTWHIAGYEGLQHHFRLAIGMPRQLLEPALEKLRREFASV
jgi:cystathionine beta-lyase